MTRKPSKEVKHSVGLKEAGPESARDPRGLPEPWGEQALGPAQLWRDNPRKPLATTASEHQLPRDLGLPSLFLLPSASPSQGGSPAHL